MSAKRLVLVVSIFGILLFFLFGYSDVFHLCATVDDACIGAHDAIAEKFVIFFPALFLSLVTFFMEREVSRIWSYFAMLWIALDLLIDFIMPEDHTSGGWGVPTWGVKGSLMIDLWIYFCIISVLLIIGSYVYLRLRKK